MDRAPSIEVTLRQATDADSAFLRQLYGAARAREMEQFPFDQEQKRAFLDQQFAAQSKHYAIHYPNCDRSIIERDGVAIGRLWVDEWGDQTRIVDIALTPEWRGSGIGSRLLLEVLNRAAAAGKAVTIHVEVFNPALRLYQRLGFREVDTNGVYLLMRWTPSQVNTAS